MEFFLPETSPAVKKFFYAVKKHMCSDKTRNRENLKIFTT